MRMIDRILYIPVRPPKWARGWEWVGYPPEMKRRVDERLVQVAESQAIVADNVNAYFCQHYIKDETALQEDFPILTPPFGNFWIEYHRAPFEVYNGKVLSTENFPEYMGWHFLASEREDELRWHVNAMLFWEETKGDIRVMGTLDFDVDREGKIWNPSDKPYIKADEKQRGWLAAASMPCLLTISLLHCKNVEVVQGTPLEKLDRHHERKHGRPIVRFHTLNIKPMQKVLLTEGNIEHTGLQRALHICRGHFKTFSAKGLFGKHYGTYWWGAQARGNISVGVADKDYRVSEPSDAHTPR